MAPSRTPGKRGHTVTRNLVRCGFPGRISPVNPAGEEVEGLPCYPSIAALPERVRRDAAHDHERRDRENHGAREAALAAARDDPLVFELAAAAPFENRLRQDVVEDLVARALRPVLCGTDNPLFDEPLEHVLGLGLSDRCVAGEIAGPVAEFTVAGNLLAMFARMVPANDLEWHRPINAPTLRIDGMTVAGD